jgi:uncharacterized SAM-binding protein YcdF (DUF218 family)
MTKDTLQSEGAKDTYEAVFGYYNCDAIVILGSKPNTVTWEFPKHVYDTLDYASEVFAAGKARKIIVSGNYALSFDEKGIIQPYRECDKMASYLLSKGVPSDVILTEGESKDTISNLVYIKQQILAPRGLYKPLIITADFRVERIQFLADKIIGPSYSIGVVPIASDAAGRQVYPNEIDTLRRTKLFLKDMTDGDDTFLDGKFYGADYYQ